MGMEFSMEIMVIRISIKAGRISDRFRKEGSIEIKAERISDTVRKAGSIDIRIRVILSTGHSIDGIVKSAREIRIMRISIPTTRKTPAITST